MTQYRLFNLTANFKVLQDPFSVQEDIKNGPLIGLSYMIYLYIYTENIRLLAKLILLADSLHTRNK